MKQIEIKRFKEIESNSTLLGFLDIRINIWSLIINNIKVYKEEDGYHFAFPGYQGKVKGRTFVSNYVYIDNEAIYKSFYESLVDEFKDYLRTYGRRKPAKSRKRHPKTERNNTAR